MNLAEALRHVEAGERIRSSALSQGCVVKRVPWRALPVVFNERTESNYYFDPEKLEHIEADWELVKGWA
jgi:hypothetical protein